VIEAAKKEGEMRARRTATLRSISGALFEGASDSTDAPIDLDLDDVRLSARPRAS
jgi:hypothetical protein